MTLQGNFRCLIAAAAIVQTAFVSGALAQNIADCDSRTDFNYGSVCGNLSISGFTFYPGDKVTVTASPTGCFTSGPDDHSNSIDGVSVSGADVKSDVTVDGKPGIGVSNGAAAPYSGWDPLPSPTASVIVGSATQMADGQSHTVQMTIKADAAFSCIKVNGHLAVGPWVIMHGTSKAGGWSVAKPIRIAGAYLFAAVAPSAITMETGSIGTAWASLTNVFTSGLDGCAVAPINLPAGTTFHYQTTDPKTNQLAGKIDTPTHIDSGATASFILDFITTQDFPTTEIMFNFTCSGAPPAPVWSGLDTLKLTSQHGIPNMIGWQVPLNQEGSALSGQNVAGGTLDVRPGDNVVAVVVRDIGTDKNTPITVAPRIDGKFNLAQQGLTICETDASGKCKTGEWPPTQTTVTTTVSQDQNFTYTVYLKTPPCLSSQYRAVDLHNDRLYVVFKPTSGNDNIVKENGEMSIAMEAVTSSSFCPGGVEIGQN